MSHGTSELTTKAYPESKRNRMMQPSVLIVEDDSDIAGLIEFNVAREGYRTQVTHSGVVAMEIIAKDRPDLVILDIMLPDLDGLEVCRRLKSDAVTDDICIIMVSAKGEEADVVAGLELGADDYVTKPFSPRVLLARMKSVLRRRPAEPSDRIILDDGNLIIDPARHETIVNGKTVDLTLTQYEILHYLARRPGFVRTRQQIVSAVRGDDTILSGRAIDVHVAGLRQKLKGHGKLIETVRGVGYRIAERLSPEVD